MFLFLKCITKKMKGAVSMSKPKYKRVMLKISGLDKETISAISDTIKEVYDMGVEIAIVVGGGNFWRGRAGEGMDRTTADHMGMLATVINSLALQDALEKRKIPTRVQTAIEMRQIAEPYIRRVALKHLEKRRIVIFACGTGNPYFSTDTAAALRAAEIDADIILLAKSVDGVYDKDPALNVDAKRLDKITHKDVISRELGVMDTTAASLCMDNDIPILVFGLKNPESIVKAVCGEVIGTEIVK